LCAIRYGSYWYSRPRYQRIVFLRDNFTCQVCGLRPVASMDGYRRPDLHQLHVDHIHPFSKGGLTAFDNLQTLCRRCNLSKGSRLSTI